MKPKTLPFRPTRLTATQLADYIENGLSPKESKEADDQWAVSHCNLCASLIRKHLVLHWSKDLPTEPGHYWYRNGLCKSVSVLRLVFSAGGILGEEYADSESCEFNSVSFYSNVCDAQWAGPIPPPEGYAP